MLKLWIRDSRRRLLIACLLCITTPAGADGLRDALQATLRNNPAVAGQAAEVEARRYAADGARSQRYPTLSAQAQQYADGDRSGLNGEDVSRPSILRVRQPIWSFGRINDSIAVANAEVSTERADLLRVRRQLLEDTAVSYVTVRGSIELIDIAEQNEAEHKQLLAQIQRRVEGQLASSADARLAATRLAQAQAMVQRAINEKRAAREDLAALTQVMLGADEPVPSGLLELQASTNLLDQAMDQSAQIRLKRQQLGQAEAEVERAKTYSMPTIYLQADKLYDQPGLSDDSQVSVVFEGSLDGLGFADRGRRGEASASRMAAIQDLAAAKIELKREIDGLQRSRRLQTDLIELQTQSLSDLVSLFDSYQRQYESGTKSWLDLLNIQRERFEQNRQLVQAQTEWRIYSLQLQAMIGGLDSLAGIEAHNDG